MSRPLITVKAALAVLFGTLTLLLAIPSQAPASVASFSCTLLAPNTWCRHPVWHNYYAMGVSYPGSGTIPVCARMVRVVAGGVYASVCGNNHATANFARCNCGGLWNDIKHSGPNARNLNGWGAF